MADRILKPDSGNDLILQNDDASAKIEINEDGSIPITGTIAGSVDVSGGSLTTSSAQKQAIVQAGPGSGTLDVSSGTFTTSTSQKQAIVDGASLSASTVGLGNVTNESKATMFTSPTFTGTASFSDQSITNVSDISLDTISSDSGTSIGVTLGTDSGDDFNVGGGKLVVKGDSGNVGIGTDSPNDPCHVIGSTPNTNNLLLIHKVESICTGTVANGFGARIQFNTSMTGQNNVELGSIGFYNDDVSGAYGNFVVYTRPNATSAIRLTVANNGSVGAPSGTNLYNPSDARLKQNVTNLTGSLEKIKQMQGVSFNWIDGFCDPESDKTLYGLIAQDLQSVDLNLVDSFVDDSITVNDVTVENPLRVNEKFIIPVLVEAVKELSAKVTALENA
jgi:hypothetical protein